MYYRLKIKLKFNMKIRVMDESLNNKNKKDYKLLFIINKLNFY